MPELLIDFITSLDGYAAADGWPGWWGLEGPEYLAWLGEQPEGDFTVLMGAATYRIMSGFAAEGEPGTDSLAGMSKIVFSTTLSEPLSWANTQLVTQDPVAAVRDMKDNAAKPMRTIGSLTLCRSLLKAGLVDRFRVVVFPVITGSSGRERIYDGYPDVALDMTSSRTFDGRIQLLEYIPTLLANTKSLHKTLTRSASACDAARGQRVGRRSGSTSGPRLGCRRRGDVGYQPDRCAGSPSARVAGAPRRVRCPRRSADRRPEGDAGSRAAPLAVRRVRAA
jgi:dihydrofolate reductase